MMTKTRKELMDEAAELVRVANRLQDIFGKVEELLDTAETAARDADFGDSWDEEAGDIDEALEGFGTVIEHIEEAADEREAEANDMVEDVLQQDLIVCPECASKWVRITQVVTGDRGNAVTFGERVECDTCDHVYKEAA